MAVQETGLYYLQSRYYDPELGRFLNADAFTSTGQGFVGNNMFAYCGNNPVAHSDAQGTRPVSVLEGEGYSVPVPKRARAKKENVIDSLVEQTRISKRIVTHNNEKYTTYYVTIDSDAFFRTFR